MGTGFGRGDYYDDPEYVSLDLADTIKFTSKTVCTTGLYRDNSYSPSACAYFCLIRVLVDRSFASCVLSTDQSDQVRITHLDNLGAKVH